MMPPPVIAAADAFARALATERFLNARRLAWFRLLGVSGFFVLTVAAGWMTPQRREYTAIGDAVNVASRIEQLTKVHDVPILVSEETRRGVGDGIAFASVGSARVKGRVQPVDCWVPAAQGAETVGRAR